MRIHSLAFAILAVSACDSGCERDVDASKTLTKSTGRARLAVPQFAVIGSSRHTLVAELVNVGTVPLAIGVGHPPVKAYGPYGASYATCRNGLSVINPGERLPCIWRNIRPYPRGMKLEILDLEVAAEPRPVIHVEGAKIRERNGSWHVVGTAHNRSDKRLAHCHVVGLGYEDDELVVGWSTILSTEKAAPDLGIMEKGERQAFDLWFAKGPEIAFDEIEIVAGGDVDTEGPATTADGKHRCSKPLGKRRWSEHASLTYEEALAIRCAVEDYVYSEEAVSELGQKNARFLRTRTHKSVLFAEHMDMHIGEFDVHHRGDEVELSDLIRHNHDGTVQMVRAWLDRDGDQWRLRELRWRDESPPYK